MNKKTLVIGCEGFLGRGFFKAYQQLHPDTLGTHYHSSDPAKKLDLCAPDLTHLNLKKGEYQYALIAAAHTDLALCEREKGMPFRRNVEGILEVIRALIKKEIQPILFSTPYVFDGRQGGYEEDAITNPINEYGRQKEILEKAVGEICGKDYLMIRCNKVFDLTQGSLTLIDQMCSQLAQKQIIKAAYDQVFSPLLLDDLVNAVIALQKNGCKGLYNLCNQEIWTRYDLAKQVAMEWGEDPHLVVPISLDEIQSPFRMPKRTNLDCRKFHSHVQLPITPLSVCIKKIKKSYLSEVKNDG